MLEGVLAAALLFSPPLVFVFFISLLDRTFPVTGRGTFTRHLPLPINAAQMDGWLAVMYTLFLQAQEADPDVQTISLVGPVLDDGPLFPPDFDVLFTIVLKVLFLTESL